MADTNTSPNQHKNILDQSVLKVSCNCGQKLFRLEKTLKDFNKNYALFPAPHKKLHGEEQKIRTEEEIKSRTWLIQRKHERECVGKQDHARS
jgi:hypothetical protein